MAHRRQASSAGPEATPLHCSNGRRQWRQVPRWTRRRKRPLGREAGAESGVQHPPCQRCPEPDLPLLTFGAHEWTNQLLAIFRRLHVHSQTSVSHPKQTRDTARKPFSYTRPICFILRDAALNARRTLTHRAFGAFPSPIGRGRGPRPAGVGEGEGARCWQDDNSPPAKRQFRRREATRPHPGRHFRAQGDALGPPR